MLPVCWGPWHLRGPSGNAFILSLIHSFLPPVAHHGPGPEPGGREARRNMRTVYGRLNISPHLSSQGYGFSSSLVQM